MANRWALRVAGLLVPALVLLPGQSFGGAVHAQEAAVGACMGKVKVSPNPVHVGDWFTVTGSGFSCKDMANKVYPVVSVIIFQPKLGFVIYTPHVRHGGYKVHVHFPGTLTNVGAINGKPTKSVAVRPGRYYVDIRLSDVSVDPAAAQAKFQVSK
jgi:hypothetical protein